MSGDSLYLIVDENGEFKEKHMEQALSTARESGSVDNSRNKNSATQNIVRITKFMVERKFAPVIIFSFSKKECEHYARSISTMDFNEPRDKKMISEVFLNAIEALSDEDKNLPQVQSVLPLLKRGIGIHHSGLLPILKEVTEILFSEGLIKFLFATETFAMGLNMPARTVVFTSCRKYDGVENRFIQSGEYIQMSGRAGRRGIDDRGICILMIDDQMTINTAKSLIWGTADPLNSAFRLTYNMILNLLRIEGIDPEYMMKKSFFQHQISSNVPEIIEKLKELKKEYDEIKIKKPAKLDSYVKLVHEEKIARKEKAGFLADPKFTSPFLQPGRLVKIKSFTDNFGWGCIVNSNNRKTVKMSLGAGGKQLSYVDVLLNCAIKTLPGSMKKTYLPSETMSPNIIPVACHLFTDISILDKIKAFKDELKDVRSIVQLNDLKARKRVLRRLGFLDSSDMIDVKGRVACEISTADELVLTELIFNGFFNDISHRGVCAVLSCLLYQEKSFEGQEGLSEENKKLYRSLMETVKRVAKVSSDCKLQIDVQSYINGFKNDLMEVFSNWASGANFETVCKLSDVFEGSIIRCLRRLDELLKQLIQAAKVIGNAELEKKFKECSEKIKRNIAFSASLYL
ncbi:hypothetical protein MXB_4339 [Myxobolus squamalis]|nr:hypothetical protein MXB_4339 [Myxobolus squamalis]